MTLVVRPWCRTWYVMSWHWVHTSVWSWHGNEPILQSTVCLIWMGLDICLYDSPYCGLELPAWYIIVDIIVLTYAIDELHARYLVTTHQVIVHTMAYDVTKPPRGEYTSTWWCDTISKPKGSLGFVKIWSKGSLVFVRKRLEGSNRFVKTVQGMLGVVRKWLEDSNRFVEMVQRILGVR